MIRLQVSEVVAISNPFGRGLGEIDWGVGGVRERREGGIGGACEAFLEGKEEAVD